MTLLRRNTVFAVCAITTATLSITPTHAKPDDYSFELAKTSGDIVTIRLKNEVSNELVPGALIDCAVDVGPQDVTTMTEPMFAQPGLKKGEYVLILEPGMQAFDVNLVAEVPGENQAVTGTIHVKDQSAN
jgi:hypothetical protein